MKAPELQGFIATLLETEHDKKKPGQSPALRSEKPAPSRVEKF
jgi:hypothetical protein